MSLTFFSAGHVLWKGVFILCYCFYSSTSSNSAVFHDQFSKSVFIFMFDLFLFEDWGWAGRISGRGLRRAGRCMQVCRVWAKGPVFGCICSRLNMWKPSGHIRQKPQCLEEEKEVSYYWSISAINTHSFTHIFPKPQWCQQQSSVVLPPWMTAAVISGRPSHGHVSYDWWELCIQAQTASRSLAAQTAKFSSSMWINDIYLNTWQRNCLWAEVRAAKCASSTALNSRNVLLQVH